MGSAEACRSRSAEARRRRASAVRRRHASPLACGLLVAAACAPGPPPGSTPRPKDAGTDPFGAWVRCEFRAGEPKRVDGELLAVSADSLWLYVGGVGVRAAALASIRSAHVFRYESDAGMIGAVSLLGLLSTASHGAWLVFSAPAWPVVGLVAAHRESAAARLDVESPAWAQLRPYARYPGGWPAGLDWRRVEPGRGRPAQRRGDGSGVR